MIRVGVLGAAGRMGAEVCRAVDEADDLTLAAVVDPALEADGRPKAPAVGASIDQLDPTSLDVIVDFTHPDAVASNIDWCIENQVNVVVGTSGLPREAAEVAGARAAAGGTGVFVAPNFAIGAVLMMRFAAEAAKHLPIAEIVELHHDRKADAPSGTAVATADAMATARDGRGFGRRHSESKESIAGARGADAGSEIRIHSLRLPGLVAHQEVILSGPGETLTIRHDSLDRAGFMPGVVMAIRAVVTRPGLTFGLDAIL